MPSDFYLHFKNIELTKLRHKHMVELTERCYRAFQEHKIKVLNNRQIQLAEAIHNKQWTEEELRIMGIRWHRETEDGYEEKDIGTVN